MGGRGRVKGWCWEGRGIEKKLKNAFSERPQAFPARDQSWALKAEGGRGWGGITSSQKGFCGTEAQPLLSAESPDMKD